LRKRANTRSYTQNEFPYIAHFSHLLAKDRDMFIIIFEEGELCAKHNGVGSYAAG